MVIDSSAIVAILLNESDSDLFIEAMIKADILLLSAVSLVEITIVLGNRMEDSDPKILKEWIEATQIQVMPVTLEQAELAQQAFREYGKGRHPASLNFGDCFSYALAKHMNQPLLFKGNDFNCTDISIALDLT